jgi:hypothetical protein
MLETLKFREVLIVGTARNIAQHINPYMHHLMDAFSEVAPVKVLIIESDSIDSTLENLRNLEQKDSRVTIKTLGKIEPLIPDRVDRIRHCRNFAVSEIRHNAEFKYCDLIVVADLDGVNSIISRDAINLALSTQIPWDALSANQSGRYYDILALRHPLWSPNDCFTEAKWLSQFMGEYQSFNHSVLARMINIPTDGPPIAVDSAFGGLCLYKRWVFDKADYNLDENAQINECEHVTFHRKIGKLGAQIYIHPGLINAKWTSHSFIHFPGVSYLSKIFHIRLLSFFLPLLRKLKTAFINSN